MRRLLLLGCCLLIGACSHLPFHRATSEVPMESPPGNLANTPDAEPKEEPLSSQGNKSPYAVSGKTYRVLPKAEGYEATGRASWYGKKFQGRKTASGERFNMFAMTGAHRSLPLPSYVRVTNLSNKKSVVIRINDRGPFAKGRLIDVSYAAAVKLGFLSAGSVRVKVEAVIPIKKEESEIQTYPIPLNDTIYSEPPAIEPPTTEPVAIEPAQQ